MRHRLEITLMAVVENFEEIEIDDDEPTGETNWSWWAAQPDQIRNLDVARNGDLSTLTQEELIDALRALSKTSTVKEWFGLGKFTLERRRHDEIHDLLLSKYGVFAQICQYWTDVDVTYGVEPFDD